MAKLYNTDVLSHMLTYESLYVFVHHFCCPALSKHLGTLQTHVAQRRFDYLPNELESLYLTTTALHAKEVNLAIRAALIRHRNNLQLSEEDVHELQLLFHMIADLLTQLKEDFKK